MAKKQVTDQETTETIVPVTEDVESVTNDSIMEEMLSDDSVDEFMKHMIRTYQKRRYTMMSKKEQSRAYKNEHIVGGKGDYKTEKDKIREEAKELLAAAQAVPPEILTGTVYGYEYTEHGIPMVLLTRPEKPNFVVKIPLSQFYMYDESIYAGEDGKRRLEHELRSRINSEVEFVIYSVIEAEMVAYASRLKAMELRSNAFFKARKGKKQAEIVEGSRTLAKVTSVKNNRIRVEVKGVETEIKSEELSWRALNELTLEFSVGQEFEVIVHDIIPVEYMSLDQKYNLYTIRVSKKEAEQNPAEKYFSQYHVDQVIGGEIKAHNEVGVFVDLNGKIDVLCKPKKSGATVRGEKCIVRITATDEKNYRLYGVIIQ